MERHIVAFENPQAFETWLEEHHSQHTGIWVRIAKKGAGIPSVTYAEALLSALCFGWIDGQKDKFDDSSWLQYFCQRKKNSLWSQVNRQNTEILIQAGRMRAPGLAAIDEAKASGRWDSAYQPTRSREVPEDLLAALNHSPKAKVFFDSLSSQNRFAFVFRVSTAKKSETRTKRIEEFVRMMENGEVFYPKKDKP